MKRVDHSPSLRGQKWRETHQATVDSILGPKVRTIKSRGSTFYNKDSWTARTFIAALCEWARLNKGRTPERFDVEGWVAASNRDAQRVWDKGIVIASTPDELPKGLSFALVGGAYHEAWHTKWSRRTPLTVAEVWPKVLDMWALIPYAPERGKPGWTGLTGPLLDWSNIIEDIRIERLGCAQYPGAIEKMEALQDLILEMEEEGRAATEHRAAQSTNDDLSVVVGAFRDLGLGYLTPKQKGALIGYQKRSLGSWKFVTEGPLSALLKKSTELTPEGSLDCLWMAMEIVAAIASTVPDKEKKAKEEPKTPELPSEGEEEAPAAPSKPSQPELPDPPDEDEHLEGVGAPPPPPADENEALKRSRILYKVGDRGVLKEGPYAGRTVEVVRAGLPDEAGLQAIDYALVEDEGTESQESA